jgi:hypothetical protein
MSSKLRTASWVVLSIVGVLTLLGAVESANLAYRGTYGIAGVSISDIASGREEVLRGLRGARGTAAAWAAAWAVLFLIVVFGPYRRGDVASWWGLLASAVVLAAVTALRVPLVNVTAGIGPPLVLLAVVILALLLDVRRLAAPR